MQVAPSWEVDFGARYAGTSSKFQKDLGVSGVGAKSLASRLTYDNMWSDGGELFARIDTPSNIMVKGFVGLGSGNSGHMNDEDWMLSAVVPYLNTVSNISQDITYGTIDAGYDVFRGAGYKGRPLYRLHYLVAKHEGPWLHADRERVLGLRASAINLRHWHHRKGHLAGPAVGLICRIYALATVEADGQSARGRLTVSFTGTDNHVLRNLVPPELLALASARKSRPPCPML